ncbi:MAG: hypothetical protein EAZ08_12615 [Cytophagales bacterium]|nr:MAG: hypothetical protein EAZ08_12615 [Cytophagales bacterium]
MRYRTVGLLVCTALAMLSSCIKLQEKSVKFDVNCPKCIKNVLDSIYSMKGIHYATYNEVDNSLIVKFDTANFSVRHFNFFLTENGYIKINQDSSRRIPACCE